jgi:hypothetical protein
MNDKARAELITATEDSNGLMIRLISAARERVDRTRELLRRLALLPPDDTGHARS